MLDINNSAKLHLRMKFSSGHRRVLSSAPSLQGLPGRVGFVWAFSASTAWTSGPQGPGNNRVGTISPPRECSGAIPTSAGMQTPRGPRCPGLTAGLLQPVPEQVASVLLPGRAFLHSPPLHLKVKYITHPHPKVERGHLHRRIQPGYQFESVWKGLSCTVGAQQ